MKKIFTVLLIGLLLTFTGCATTSQVQQFQVDEDEIMSVINEVAAMFFYYPELNPNVKNLIVGESEVGGQCGDYALAFVNIWNERYPGQAFLVIQNQNRNEYPNGIYRVVRKLGYISFPPEKDLKLSSIFLFNGILGFYHPEFGNWEVRLVERISVRDNNFSTNNHVWVKVGNYSIDPQLADAGGSNYILRNIF